MSDHPSTTRRARFEALYSGCYQEILGYALRRTASPEDAADVVAETFAAAWRRLDDVPEGDQARLWLYGAARRVLANHQRGERRRSARIARLRDDLEHSAPSARQPDDGTELAAITQAFRQLPANDQELLGLLAWEGLDHAEIAQVLGCSSNAVRIRLHRARRRFSRRLAAVGVAPAPATGPDEEPNISVQLRPGETS